MITGILLLLAFAASAQDGPDRIIIPHGTHFENDVSCLDCHEGVEASTSAGESFRPDMETCEGCHEVDDDETCTMCHTNPDEAGDYPGLHFGAAGFAHAPHVGADMDCAACHGDPAADSPALPGKPDCRGCHETADDYGDCRLCHAVGEELRPDTHDLAWINHHGIVAREDQDRCALCHTQTTCQECHVGDNVRPRSHRLNYAFDHALDARGNEMDCAVCHQDPDYCSSCHIAEHVLPLNHSQGNWVNGGDGGRHGLEGLFDIENCVACHSAGENSPTCAACHGG